MDNIVESFATFATKTKEGGVLILNGDSPYKDKVLDNEIQRARNIANEFYSLKEQWRENVATVIKFHSGLAKIEKKLERLEKKVGE